MKTILSKVQDPESRGLALSTISGGLILSGLLAGWFLEAGHLRDGLMLAAALITGTTIGVQAWRSLLHKHISIDLLVTIATAGALIIGEYWEAAAVSFLFIFGAYLEARTLSNTREVLQGLLEIAPSTAVVLRNEQQVEVLPQDVQQGEKVLVKPGAKVPVDGTVIEGQSTVDQSAITGESMPEEKVPGAEVYAGTVNQAGLLKVKATGVGSDTTLARIIRRVEEAQEEKAPTQRFIERFAKYYTPFILFLSGSAYLLTRNLNLALTLLVISCPGALVVSTPVSIVAGIGRAAKSGILIKGGEYLENAGSISALALDKTGTITEGKPRVTQITPWPPESPRTGDRDGSLTAASPVGLPLESRRESRDWSPTQMEVLQTAAAVESGSEHPLARAILDAAGPRPGAPDISGFETHTGLGVSANYNGREIAVGSLGFMRKLDIHLPSALIDEIQEMRESGVTAVVVARGTDAVGLIGISDRMREPAPGALRKLKGMGVDPIVMLTGDDPVTAQTIANEAKIEDVRANLLPEDKLDLIRELQAAGHVVAMVGDGVNDAPALAAADIGIAMGAAGTDIAIETADIALMADEIEKLPEAISLSKSTMNNIRQNVVFALATVGGLLTGVLLGEVHMASGMLIHEISVMAVILNAMRLMKI